MKMTMKAEQFYRVKFMYPVGYELLRKYKSPYDEISLAKGIPLTLENRVVLAELGKVLKIKLRYRGPRAASRMTEYRSREYAKQRGRYSCQSTCLKETATSVAVYLR